MSRNWFIVHFQPLEKYPPVVNFINFVTAQPDYKNNLHVITTAPGFGEQPYQFSQAHIHRVVSWKRRNRLGRLLFYVRFNAKALWLLAKHRPQLVFYYETLSAFAPVFYKKWINPRAAIYVHYHEYTSTNEYAGGMALNRWLHKQERKLYSKTAFVSHTNASRMGFFLKDVAPQIPGYTSLLPNHPPANWYNQAAAIEESKEQRIGIVYVGALSMKTMHTREMAEFVAAHPNECFWHIYSANHDAEVLEFLNKLDAPNIFFKGSVDYNDLPRILPQYDIGVILYTGSTPNYTWNAPNKFFEYYVCGLNTWFGKGMKGMYEYEQPSGRPWVRCVDFNQLALPPLAEARRSRHIQNSYTAEQVYEPLWRQISNATSQ